MNGANLSYANATNATTETSLLSKWIFSLSYGIIEAFGLCGNILVMLTICNGSRRLKTNYYLLIFHLALCDIILLLKGNFLFTLGRLWLANNYWSTSLGTATCRIILPLSGCLFSTEMALLVLIAILRYKAVTQPFEPRMSGRKLKCLIALVYFTPLLLHIPLFHSQEATGEQCTNKWIHNVYFIVYQWVLDLAMIFIPMIFIVTLYTKMCYCMTLHQKNLRLLFAQGTTSLAGKMAKHINQNHYNMRIEKNAKMMIITVIIFAQLLTAVLPIRVLGKLVIHNRDEDKFHLVWMMPLYLLISCSFNPIVYGFGDKTIRTGYRIVLSKLIVC